MMVNELKIKRGQDGVFHLTGKLFISFIQNESRRYETIS